MTVTVTKKASNQIKISVIILFYYGERWIKKCVDSLLNQSLPKDSYEIILVDNGGSTPSVKDYEGKANLKVLFFKKNLGFALGNNRALPYADGDYILLMNQDIVVHYNCLAELIAAFEAASDAGTISANMLMVSSRNAIDPNCTIADEAGIYRLTRLGYAAYYTKKVEHDVEPVKFASGNALCFRKSVLNDIGNYLFDERLGSYAEDLDLSIRLQTTHWKMYVCPNAVVYHLRDDAFSGNATDMLKKLFHISSNRLLVFCENLSPFEFLKMLPLLIIGIPFKVSRSDNDPHFHVARFTVAAGLTPFIFIYFIIRLFNFRRTEIKP
ncbi:glycosyltransferase family 2 protein [Thermodesulfobacteriota bacterium]